jgi:hypothetical protein
MADRLCRKPEAKRHPLSQPVPDLDLAPVRPHDPPNHREPQPRADLLGGEEGIEDIPQHPFGDAAAGVAHFQDHPASKAGAGQ